MFSDKDYISFGISRCVVVSDGLTLYGDNAEPWNIAELIRRTCPSILPYGFEWSVTCDKPRLDHFGGGYFVMTKDSIAGGSTTSLRNKLLTRIDRATQK